MCVKRKRKNHQYILNLPTKIKINAGSNATFDRRGKLVNVSFSFHAQTPTAITPSPSHCEQKEKTFNINIIIKKLSFHLNYLTLKMIDEWISNKFLYAWGLK